MNLSVVSLVSREKNGSQNNKYAVISVSGCKIKPDSSKYYKVEGVEFPVAVFIDQIDIPTVLQLQFLIDLVTYKDKGVIRVTGLGPLREGKGPMIEFKMGVIAKIVNHNDLKVTQVHEKNIFRRTVEQHEDLRKNHHYEQRAGKK